MYKLFLFRTSILFLLITLSIHSSFAFQSEGLKVSFAQNGADKGFASGDRLLQLRGYTLPEIVHLINPHAGTILDSKSLQRTLFDFEYRGDLSDKQKVLNELNAALKNDLSISMELSSEKTKIYTFDFKGESGCYESGVIDKQEETEKYWKGTCVKLSMLAEKIYELYGTVFHIKPQDDLVIPSVKISKVNFDGMKKGLKDAELTLVLDETATLNSKTYVYTK